MLILLANNARDHDVDNSFYILLRIFPNLPFAKTSKDLLQELTDLILDELQIGG